MKAIFGLIAAGCIAVTTALVPATATAGEGIKVGILHCKKVPGKGINLLIHSVSVVDCELISPEGRERYRGEAGVGVGAQVLVGGGSKNISLQPLAVETATGLGVAGGLGYLYLEAAK